MSEKTFADGASSDEAGGGVFATASSSTITVDQVGEALRLMMSREDSNHRFGEEPEDYDVLAAVRHSLEDPSLTEGFADLFDIKNW